MSGYTPARSKIFIGILAMIAAACVLQFIWMVIRLANISSFPPEQWGIVQLSTNLQILLSVIGLICLYGAWNRDRKLTYGFYGVAVANIALSVYASQPLLVLVTIVIIGLHLIALRYR